MFALPFTTYVACGEPGDRTFGAGTAGTDGGSGSGGIGGVSGNSGSGGSVSSGGSSGSGGGAGTGGSSGSIGSGGSGGALTDAANPDAESDSGPVACEGQDQGESAFARWPMPTESTLGLRNAQSYTVQQSVVKDNVTGLVWQRGVSPDPLPQVDAVAYCQSLVLGGCSDWRLPSMIELTSITDLTTQDPSIDGLAFPGTPSDDYWTTTRRAGNTTNHWIVTFLWGAPNSDASTALHYARCTRDPIARTGQRYTVDTTTVRDSFTGLVWQRNPSATQVDFATASQYCADLTLDTLNGFRLPTRNELMTIVDTSQNIAVDTTVFGLPTGVNYFWSASSDAGTARPWFVAFREGGTPYSDPITTAGARCVM